jgi:hypothetical protein
MLGKYQSGECSAQNRVRLPFMQRKIFWITFGSLGLIADLLLPFWWALAATIPLLAFSWWFAYRSDWFD